MRNFLTKENLFYRIQQLIILALHLILLKWMHYSLAESGTMQTQEVFYHFFGMAIYGAVLIRGCAAWGKWLHQKELKNESANLD